MARPHILNEKQGKTLLLMAQGGATIAAMSAHVWNCWGLVAGRGAVRAAIARTGARYTRGRWERKAQTQTRKP